MELGERIRQLRERRRWTQAFLGDALGVSAKTVANWESGRHHPRASMGALEVVFETSLSEDEVTEARDPVEVALADSVLVPWRQDAVRSVYRQNLEAQRADQARGTA